MKTKNKKTKIKQKVKRHIKMSLYKLQNSNDPKMFVCWGK